MWCSMASSCCLEFVGVRCFAWLRALVDVLEVLSVATRLLRMGLWVGGGGCRLVGLRGGHAWLVGMEVVCVVGFNSLQ